LNLNVEEAALLSVLAHRLGVSRPNLIRSYIYSGAIRTIGGIPDLVEPHVSFTQRGNRFGVPKQKDVDHAMQVLKDEGLLQGVMRTVKLLEEMPMPAAAVELAKRPVEPPEHDYFADMREHAEATRQRQVDDMEASRKRVEDDDVRRRARMAEEGKVWEAKRQKANEAHKRRMRELDELSHLEWERRLGKPLPRHWVVEDDK
jgi:hypothetical protein